MDTGGRLSGEGAPGKHRRAGSDWALRAEGSTEHRVVGRSRLRFHGGLDGLQVSVLTCRDPGTVPPVLTTGRMSKRMTRGPSRPQQGAEVAGQTATWELEMGVDTEPRLGWKQLRAGGSCPRAGTAWMGLESGPGSGGWGPCSELHLQEPHEVLSDDQLSSRGRGNEPS